MSQELLQYLRGWRESEAKKRGLEEYRILQNRSIEEIAEKQPTSRDELLEVYGVAEKKADRYGKEILKMVAAYQDGSLNNKVASEDSLDIDEPVSVSTFLAHVNHSLASIEASVQGEVTQIKEKYGNYYLTLSDSDDESAMDCIIKERHYDMAGFEIEEGMEVVLSGAPSIYKKYGRFSFRARAVELVGEGALKKAYEKLKAKLDKEGLFADDRKKEIPKFAQEIGLITSQGSDAYHDFAANLDQYGFEVQFYSSRVQGGRAVEELLEALTYFSDTDIDALVITRGGGGDLEVLQAFNNENVVRRVAEMDIPIIAGIGHEKDVPLTSLVADMKVSTPTGAAEILNSSWQKLENYLHRFAQSIPARYQEVLREKEHRLQGYSQTIRQEFHQLFQLVNRFSQQLKAAFSSFNHALKQKKTQFARAAEKLMSSYTRSFESRKQQLEVLHQRLKDADPRRKLSQGYSIVKSDSGIVRSIGDISTGESIDIRVSDGTITSQVTDTQPDDE